MLIRVSTLKRIQSGEVTLAFRRWRRPTVKTGGTLTTAIGVLTITSVERTSLRAITDADARQAGYAERETLLDELNKRDGQLFRIKLAYAGADPRILMRENDKLSREELTDICRQLRRYDMASRHGDWVILLLEIIRDCPRVPAAQLASQLGLEKVWLKTNVRKLKNLGLTKSHSTGYSLSPRGVVVLRYFRDGKQ